VTWSSAWLPDVDPAPWDTKAYANLRDSMNSIPKGKMRDAALNRIETLDCGNLHKNSSACDPSPPEVLYWRKKFEEASVDDEAYNSALAKELRGFVCASDTNAIYILRGVIRGLFESRFDATEREAPALVDFIMSKDCPVSASLTDDDRAKLLKIKQDADQISGPTTASKKQK
jgi:hypothetical protein